MKVYISGKISGTDDYMERFAKAEETIKAAGYIVVNPARVNAELPEETTHEEYMITSLAMLSMCDVIYMLKGWQDSIGAGIEFEYAYEHNITITFEEGKKAL